RAAVACLEDLLEADVHVQRVTGIDGNDLVVPGLHARPVAARQFQRRPGPGELLRIADLIPRPGHRARRAEYSGQVRVQRVGVVDDRFDGRIELRAVARVGKLRSADVLRVET